MMDRTKCVNAHAHTSCVRLCLRVCKCVECALVPVRTHVRGDALRVRASCAHAHILARVRMRSTDARALRMRSADARALCLSKSVVYHVRASVPRMRKQRARRLRLHDSEGVRERARAGVQRACASVPAHMHARTHAPHACPHPCPKRTRVVHGFRKFRFLKKPFIDVFYRQYSERHPGYTTRAPPLSRGVGLELAIKRLPARCRNH
jgi:hypothetical protein